MMVSGWYFTEVLCIPASFVRCNRRLGMVSGRDGHGARQRWTGHPVSLSKAHEAMLPTRVSYELCFHVKAEKVV